MVNQDLYEVFVPATESIAGAVREFHVALEIAKKHDGEVWIRRNLQMEALIRNVPVAIHA
ncbi:MAG: hypothetical protein NTZ79_03015 [Proteobacteria bacterium]|nr:hypothetical protein [Pseudomonadota bacterium]